MIFCYQINGVQLNDLYIGCLIHLLIIRRFLVKRFLQQFVQGRISSGEGGLGVRPP